MNGSTTKEEKEDMVIPPMTGRFVRLRCAEEGDVAFTLAIRNDPELTKILPKISNTEQEQRDWINKQRALEDSCFMVFENLEGKPLGTIGFYHVDFNRGVCEFGRQISYGSPVENVEAMIILYDYLFSVYKMKKVVSHGQLKNTHVRNLAQRFGCQFVQEVELEWGGPSALYHLYPENYYAKRPKIVALLDAAVGMQL